MDSNTLVAATAQLVFTLKVNSKTIASYHDTPAAVAVQIENEKHIQLRMIISTVQEGNSKTIFPNMTNKKGDLREDFLPNRP